LSQDLDLNGYVDVDSIVDLYVDPPGYAGELLVENDHQKVNLEVNDGV
jgi:hypothetical protein